MKKLHLAQLNIARMLSEDINDPLMAKVHQSIILKNKGLSINIKTAYKVTFVSRSLLISYPLSIFTFSLRDSIETLQIVNFQFDITLSSDSYPNT